MTVQITEIHVDSSHCNYGLTTIVFEIKEITNGTKFVLKINSSDSFIIQPNQTIPFDKFIPLYTKALNENIHLNRY